MPVGANQPLGLDDDDLLPCGCEWKVCFKRADFLRTKINKGFDLVRCCRASYKASCKMFRK